MPDADIILVKPGSQKELYGELSAFKLTAIEPPLWGALLAAYLRKLGYRVELLDAEVENLSYVKTAERIKDAKPLLAAIVVSGTNPSASTMNMTGAGAILASLKEINPEISTLLIGLHPSALPDQTLREEKVDFVCQGEGFYTLPKLLDTLKARGAKFEIEGLWYRKDGGVLANPGPVHTKIWMTCPCPPGTFCPWKNTAPTTGTVSTISKIASLTWPYIPASAAPSIAVFVASMPFSANPASATAVPKR